MVSLEVEIPFNKVFRERILSGVKTCTSRNKRYGKEGDFFIAFGVNFRIYLIEKKRLDAVALYYHKQEGFDTPQEFVKFWKKLHPRKGFIPNQEVWVHWWKPYGVTPSNIKKIK